MIGHLNSEKTVKLDRPQSLLTFYLKALIKEKTAVIGLVIIVAFLGWSLAQGILEFLSNLTSNPGLAYIMLPHDPFQINLSLKLMPPSRSYLFGTNGLGEGVLSRLLYAMPRDAMIAVIIVLVSLFIGAALGIIAGYRGKTLDEVIMRFADSFLAVPALILVIAISVVLNASFTGAVMGLLIVWWPVYTRFFRAETLKIRNLDYVQASKLNNISKWRLFYRYLFLNSVDPVIAYAPLDFGNVILTYSTLAFLGIGLTPPIPELGAMAADGVGALPTAWWWAVFPGLVILIIVIGFVLVGDRLQDIIANRIDY